MRSLLLYLHTQVFAGSNIASVYDDNGTTFVQFNDGTTRAVTAAELLTATKASKIDTINAECKSRLFARYGPPEEQVSRALGVYGQTERDAMSAGIAATVDASNVASNAVIAAADLATVEAVTVTWPVI